MNLPSEWIDIIYRMVSVIFILYLVFSKFKLKEKLIQAEHHLKDDTDYFCLEQRKLLDQIRELRSDCESLKAENESLRKKPETLSVEAQQIIHDITAHGNSIIRITPISPGDFFWRRPQ